MNAAMNKVSYTYYDLIVYIDEIYYVYLQNQDGGVHAGLVHLCIMYFINIGLMFSTLYSEDVIVIDSGVELANTYFVKNVDGKFLCFFYYTTVLR